MAQPSISTSRGEKVSRTQAARLLFTANQSPVAVRRWQRPRPASVEAPHSALVSRWETPLGSPWKPSRWGLPQRWCPRRAAKKRRAQPDFRWASLRYSRPRGVYKQVYAVFQTEDFRAHGGIDLPDTSGTSNDIRLNFKKRYAGKRFKRLADFR